MATGVTATGATIFNQVRERNVSFMAGSVAYSAFVSIVPLLVLLLVVATALGGEAVGTRLVALAESYLTPTAEDLFADALRNAGGRAGLSVVGLVVLLWGALKMFRSLDVAFSEIYGTTHEQSLLDQIVDGIVTLAAIGVALLAAVTVGAAFVISEARIPGIGVIAPLLLVAGLTAALLPMYYRFPDVEMEVTEAVPGAIVAAVGWTLLEVGFQVYAANAGQYEAYGVLGGVLLAITWLYFGGFLLLVGAVVNAVLSGHAGEVGLSGEVDSEAEGVSIEEARARRGTPAPRRSDPKPRANAENREVCGSGSRASKVSDSRGVGRAGQPSDTAEPSGSGNASGGDDGSRSIRDRVRSVAPVVAVASGLLLVVVGAVVRWRQREQ